MAMSASVASAVAGVTIFSTSPAAKSVCELENVAVAPDAAMVAVRNCVPFFWIENTLEPVAAVLRPGNRALRCVP
jgi:hypothetical protein